MHPLLKFINELPPDERDSFAQRCGTTVAYLRKAISAGQPIREALCINIERESRRRVLCEQLRPTGVDWAFLRGSARAASQATHGAARDEQRSREISRELPGRGRDERASKQLQDRPDPRSAPPRDARPRRP